MNRESWFRCLHAIPGNLKAALRTKIANPNWGWGFALAVTVALCGAVADAQQPKKVARICYLGTSASISVLEMKPFRDRLREIGYVEGQNVTIEPRHWEGKVELLPGLVAELIRLNCDVIVTSGTEAAQAAKNGTKTIPVVMGSSQDAVRLGIVDSLARPGGNITGMTGIGAEIFGKRLELLKETVPKLARVAFIWTPTQLSADENLKETETVARFLRVGLQSLEVKEPDDFDGAFQAATKQRAQALIVGGGGVFATHQKRIVELAAKSRLPAMYGNIRYVDAGALMAYAEDRLEQYRRAAEIVDKILKGTKPADIPVERPQKFDFVINLKTAKQIGVTIPPEVLARASRIIR